MASTDAGKVFDELRAIAEGAGSIADRKANAEQRVQRFLDDLDQEAADPAHRPRSTNQRDRLRQHLQTARSRHGVGTEATVVFQHAEDVLNGNA
jgi:hypothetical protein